MGVLPVLAPITSANSAGGSPVRKPVLWQWQPCSNHGCTAAAGTWVHAAADAGADQDTMGSVIGLPRPAKQLSCGNAHSCVILDDGAVWVSALAAAHS